VIGGLSAEACSLVLDVEGEQCTSDADCVGLFGRGYECTPQRVCIEPMMSNNNGDSGMPGDGGGGGSGSELPPEWACIAKDPRIVTPIRNRSLTLRIAVTDFLTLEQPEGLVGRACDDRDVDCSTPVIDNVMPADDGYLEFEELKHGWIGYLELEAPGYLPTLVFTNKPYTLDAMPEGPTLLTRTGLESITEGGGEMINEDRGIVLLAVYDCEGNPGEGVRLVQEMRADEQSETPYYFEGSLPDRDREETIVSRRLTSTMNPLAVGGFNKVREGYQTFYGVLAATGQPIGRVSVQVRPLTMSIAELHAGY
jgi:hypothetical protein